MGISLKATDVRSRALQGAVGEWATQSDFNEWGTGFNSNPQAVQVTTVTLTDQGDSLDITITINGFDVVQNSGTGGDAASIGALLAAAINADPRVRGQVIATFDTATLTLTGVTPGLAFTVSIANDANSFLSSVTAVTAAASAAAVPPGRAVVSLGYQTNEAEELVALAASTLFTAQVIHVTPTFVDTAEFTISFFEIRGEERVFVASATSTSATSVAVVVDNMVTAVNAVMPANTMVATDGTTHLILTAEKLGQEWDVVVSCTTMGATAPTATVTYSVGPTAATSFHRAFRGVSQRPKDEEVSTIGSTSPEWPANAGLRYGIKGQMIVESAETITREATAFVELGVTADNGQFFAATSSTRIGVARRLARWARDGQSSTDNLAVLRLNVQ